MSEGESVPHLEYSKTVAFALDDVDNGERHFRATRRPALSVDENGIGKGRRLVGW
jgi:hypothetical protein